MIERREMNGTLGDVVAQLIEDGYRCFWLISESVKAREKVAREAVAGRVMGSMVLAVIEKGEEQKVTLVATDQGPSFLNSAMCDFVRFSEGRTSEQA